MRLDLRILIGVVGFLALSLAAVAVDAAPDEESASYEGLEPGRFMTRWLVGGPFPVAVEGQDATDREVQKQAFERDYLTQQGGESGIAPTVGMIHEIDGKDYRWRYWSSRTDVVNLLFLYGAKDYAIAYAWAEIDMPEAKSALLGVGSDDAVKVWLNGQLVHENWANRAARADDDVVHVDFRAGKNQLLMKVQNGDGLWGYACRLLDAKALGEKLFVAIADRDEAMVELCLAQGAEVNATDEHSFTPLHAAQMHGLDKTAQRLLEAGADPNVPMPPGGTPLGFLDILWQSLKDNYPMMEYAGAFDDTWYEECKAEIQDIPGLFDALPIMDKMLVQRLNDYHTGMYWDSKPHLITPPVQLALIEDRLVVTRCAEDLGVALGDILLEVDGADARECFDRALPTAFGATKYVKAESACREVLEGQADTEVRLKLRNAEGEDYEVVATRGAGYGGSRQREGVLSSRVINDDIAYIKIRGWGGFSRDEFDRMFEPFRDKPALIIDVRNNGGGADELAEEVISRFIDKPVLTSIGFQRHPKTDEYEKIFFVTKPRGPWRYEGKVAVLINPGCASACEHFVSGMFEAGATLIGTPTTGACGWSNGIDLPAGVTLRCSLTFPLHGKVPSPMGGIEPHRLVTPTIEDIRSGRDAVLEDAIMLLSQ